MALTVAGVVGKRGVDGPASGCGWLMSTTRAKGRPRYEAVEVTESNSNRGELVPLEGRCSLHELQADVVDRSDCLKAERFQREQRRSRRGGFSDFRLASGRLYETDKTMVPMLPEEVFWMKLQGVIDD